MVHHIEWIRNIWCYFPRISKIDPFNLYIIDNYVKRTIVRCIARVE